MSKPLVFDLGMHTGADTDYYLARGYRVIGLEANPDLARDAAKRLRVPIAAGDLTVVEAALSDRDGEAMFYLSDNTEFSSLERWRVNAAGAVSEVAVRTMTLASLIERFGAPFYIKCDIEGADAIFCRQLGAVPEKPNYVSVEGISLEWLALLVAAGYRQFKLSNQAWVRRMTPSVDYVLDGQPRSWTFTGACSGPFGEDVPGPWLSFQEAADRWLGFERLKAADPNMVLDNWFDFHAKIG